MSRQSKEVIIDKNDLSPQSKIIGENAITKLFIHVIGYKLQWCLRSSDA